MLLIKKLILDIFKNRLVRNSAALFAGSMFCAFGNYFYHLIMARMLSVQVYGELESLIALLYIISVPAGTLMMIVTKYVAQYQAEGSLNKVYTLFTSVTRRLLLVSAAGFAAIVILSGYVADFLHLSSTVPVLILALIFIIAIFLSYSRGVLNGLQKFSSTSLNMVIEVISKVALSLAFVYFSFELNGAI